MDSPYRDCFWTASGELNCGRNKTTTMYSNNRSNDNDYNSVETNQFHFENSGNEQKQHKQTGGTQYRDNSGRDWSDPSQELYVHRPLSQSMLVYKLPQLVQELGEPDIFDPTVGGNAIWKERSLKNRYYGLFKRVELHDENVPNMNPIVFKGSLYTWVQIDLSPGFVKKLTTIVPFTMYDRQKKWLLVRTDTLDNNLAVIALVCSLKKGHVSFSQVSSHHLLKKYMISICPQSEHFNRYCKSAYLSLILECLNGS